MDLIKKCVFLLSAVLGLFCSNTLTGTPQGIMVPFYVYPTAQAIQPLLDAKSIYPSLNLRVILNPNSGVGTSKNTDYVNAITKLQAAGISVLGYVATSYANRSICSVKQEINQWIQWYNPNGIFLDEMGLNHPYYANLTSFSKTKGIQYVVGNPGANVDPSYAQDVDVVNAYEAAGLPTLADYQPWITAGFAPSKISMLSYNEATYPSGFPTQSDTTFGWIYITDQNLPNPWGALSIYFSQLVDEVGCEQ